MVMRTGAGPVAIVSDRQGTFQTALSTTGVWDQSFAVTASNLFGAKDGATRGSGTTGGAGFSGAGVSSSGAGFVYLRNRWYDPQSGRFLTQDPIGLAGGVNLYAYAGNNPGSFNDPYGLCPPNNWNTSDCASVQFWHDRGSQSSSWLGRAGNAVMGALARAGELQDGVLGMGSQCSQCAKFAIVPISMPEGGMGAAGSPEIAPSEVAGKSPSEIDGLARSRGLQPKGPDPMNGRGSYDDPVTGCQRVLCHANAESPHAHVNNAAGERLNINGGVVPKNSPEAHLPIVTP